uniref:Transmembrane protein 98 n=1 Tax=Lygus hesperus TaxID=30085 RepID=A0A0A9W866_LYGHE
MDTTLAVALTLLGTIFVGSFVVLMVLCRYKNLRNKNAVYVKRLARSDMSRSDIELIDKEEKRSWERVDGRSADSDQLAEKCLALLKLCDSVDLKELSPSDFSKLHHIIHIAHSISEETNSNDSEKLRLMDGNTTRMLINVSQTLSRMDQLAKIYQRLSKRRSSCSSISCIKTAALYDDNI